MKTELETEIYRVEELKKAEIRRLTQVYLEKIQNTQNKNHQRGYMIGFAEALIKVTKA